MVKSDGDASWRRTDGMDEDVANEVDDDMKGCVDNVSFEVDYDVSSDVSGHTGRRHQVATSSGGMASSG